jgi:hypothetical protein
MEKYTISAFTIAPNPNQDLAKLALKELRISYPNLPDPTQSIINNNNMTAYNFIEPNLYLGSITMNMVIFILFLMLITTIAIVYKKQSIPSFKNPA